MSSSRDSFRLDPNYAEIPIDRLEVQGKHLNVEGASEDGLCRCLINLGVEGHLPKAARFCRENISGPALTELVDRVTASLSDLGFRGHFIGLFNSAVRAGESGQATMATFAGKESLTLMSAIGSLHVSDFTCLLGHASAFHLIVTEGESALDEVIQSLHNHPERLAKLFGAFVACQRGFLYLEGSKLHLHSLEYMDPLADETFRICASTRDEQVISHLSQLLQATTTTHHLESRSSDPKEGER
jgi:hypothetical protein